MKWFTGDRLRFSPRKGLLSPIDDVWAEIEQTDSGPQGSLARLRRQAVLRADRLDYPWVVLYRKSLFEEKGYTIPKTSTSSRPWATR